MSYVSNLLKDIAREFGRPESSVEPFIKALEENWYDTKDAIVELTDEQLKTTFKIPERIVQRMREKISGGGGGAPKVATPEMEMKPQKKLNSEKFTALMKDLKMETITMPELDNSVGAISTAIGNIIREPFMEKFRKLNLNNQTVQNKIGRFPAALDILKMVGFALVDNATLQLKDPVDTQLLEEVYHELLQLREVLSANMQSAFNPFQSSVSTTSQLNVAEFAQKSGSNTFDVVSKLESLRAQRHALMKPIKNRDVKVFKVENNVSNLATVLQKFEEEYNPSEEEQIYKEEVIKILKQMEQNSQFNLRRQKEFDELMRKPVFTETRIRIRFPDSMVLEAKFSPLETQAQVVQFAREHLHDPNMKFYLYQTPPVQKVTQLNEGKTLEEVEQVPSGLYYFGLDDKGHEAWYIQNTGFLHKSLLTNVTTI